VNDSWVDFEEKSDNFGVLMAKVVGFEKDSVFVEPINKGAVIDGGVFNL